MKWFSKLARIELVLIYLVIIAGSVVRMTGSGMGCPDWPKCFGHLIPPTERSQLEWQSNTDFKEGQIIIVDESLRVSNSNFKTGDSYQESNWSKYTKHDYAIFNAYHTWIEYINRLLGALSGLPMVMMFGISLIFIRRDWILTLLSFAGLFMLGFEAWLGKKVVDGNLIPGSITIHMLGALLIVVILCLILLRTKASKLNPLANVPLKGLLWVSLALTLVQIVIGTQVREQVDIMNEEGLVRSSWISHLDWKFYFHRSFSILIVALNWWLWRIARKHNALSFEIKAIVTLIIAEIILGIVLTYAGMPKFAQPSHLLLGTILFGFQFYALSQSLSKENKESLNESRAI